MKYLMILAALFSLSACAPVVDRAPDDSQYVRTTKIGSATVTRVDDDDRGVTCYILGGNNAISCVKVK